MKSIYIGVCKTREDQRFNDSFHRLIDEISSKYSICLAIRKNQFLADAQNSIAKDFIQAGYDYLMFLDDDQWGHTPEMVECLINANSYVATMKTYSRHYPYMCALLKKEGNVVLPMENGKGYQECDLTGFPMTLIKKELFSLIEYPYFRAIEAEGRDWNTDIEFFERLNTIGIKPIGCFQHCLNHDKITKDNVFEYREKERFEKNNMGWFSFLKELQSQGV